MAEIEWIKIMTDMFDNDKLKLIDAMPERDTIFYIWIRLLVQAGKTNMGGYIFLNEKIPFTEEMLSTIFNRQIQSVRLALSTLISFGMIEITDDKSILISNWGKYQNIEGMEKVREQNRLRKQKQRQLKRPINSDVNSEGEITDKASHVMSRDSHASEVEGDKEVDIDREITTSSTDGRDYLNFFNSNFHLANEYERNILSGYKEKGMDSEVIIMALKEAVEKNVRELSYVKKILDRWLNMRLLTVAAVKEDKAEFEKRKNTLKVVNKNNNNKISTFNNFTQREYDYDSLEKKLLGWD